MPAPSTYLLAAVFYALPALASTLDLWPQRRSASSDCRDSKVDPCPRLQMGVIIAIIVSCSVVAILGVSAGVYWMVRKHKIPQSAPYNGVYGAQAAAGELGYGEHKPLEGAKSYTHSSSTLSTTYSPRPGPPPSAETLYGFSTGAI